MKFIVEIELDNDAYQNSAVQYQLIDNLKVIINKLETQWDHGIVKDYNGNTTGEWSIES